MSPKTFDERLLYHVRRLEGKRPQNVFKRYEQRLHVAMKADELQKNAFHVAAWVAELPAEQMSLQYDGLSAVSLLQRYLLRLKQMQPLCDHLMKVLTRIWERINASSDLEEQWPGLLENLQHFVPAGKAAKAAKLMHKAISVWRNTTCQTKQEEYVAALEQSLEMADDDVLKIRSIFPACSGSNVPPTLHQREPGRYIRCLGAAESGRARCSIPTPESCSELFGFVRSC